MVCRLALVALWIACLAAPTFSAHGAAALWQRLIGGSENDATTVVCTNRDGGFLLGGFSYSGISGGKSSPGFGLGDFWVVRLDSTGAALWDRCFGGTNFDGITAMISTADGGFLLGGISYSGISGNKTTANFGDADYWLVKLDANGTKQWEQSFGGTGEETLASIQQTQDGGYVLGGHSTSGISGNKTAAGFGSSDYWIVKLDSSGNKQWDKSLGGADIEELAAVRQTGDGGYIAGGHSFSGISGNKTAANFGGANGTSDLWIVKLDGTGNKQWERSLGGNDSDLLRALEIASDGGIVLGGTSYSSVSGSKSSGNHGSQDYYLVILDPAGTVKWDRSYGGADADDLYSLEETRDGGFILGGISSSPVSGEKNLTSSENGMDSDDYWMIKVDRNGAKQWEQVIPANHSTGILRLRQNSDGGLLVAGLPNSPGGNVEFGITKLIGPIYLYQFAVLPNGMVRALAGGMSGSNYVLEASANLANWTGVKTNQANAGTVDLGYTTSVVGNRFYRVRAL